MSKSPHTPVTGRIFEIQRFSVHDGPGIRTTVFLMGCPLRCLWCHNPEGLGQRPTLSFQPDKCIGCGYCSSVCPSGAHRVNDSHADKAPGHALNRSICQACGQCAVECYAGALTLIGRDVTVSEVLAEVLRDEPFYRNSGGGLTLSGGEPLLQSDFCAAVLIAAKAVGLHCAVETCGHADIADFRRLLPYVDLFLYDIKETDEVLHVKYTGVSRKLSLDNLRALHEQGSRILIRLPIVPGLNDRPGHFAAVAELVRSLPGILGVEVMPYHALGTGKHARFGTDQALASLRPADAETVEGWRQSLRELGLLVL